MLFVLFLVLVTNISIDNLCQPEKCRFECAPKRTSRFYESAECSRPGSKGISKIRSSVNAMRWLKTDISDALDE